MSKVIKSPCTGQCQINDDAICTGCYRTLDEIVEWSSFPSEKKQAVAILSNQRLQLAQKEKTAVKENNDA